MLHDLLTELVEIYLRRAGVAEERLAQLLAESPSHIQQLARWLTTQSPERLSDDALDDALIPLEWRA